MLGTALNAAVKPLLEKPSEALTREEAHRLLDACFDLERHKGTVHKVAENAGNRIGRRVLERSLGWMWPASEPSAGAMQWPQVYSDPKAFRIELVHRFSTTPSLLPAPLLSRLIGCLDALDDGSGKVPDLLMPEPRREKEKGLNPKEAREIEDFLLGFISWRESKGVLTKVARGEVADGVGLGSDSIRGWVSDQKKRLSAEEIRELNDWCIRNGDRVFSPPNPEGLYRQYRRLMLIPDQGAAKRKTRK
ncbi:hypothetical protein IAI18_07625 [Acetobacteraceae bacterium H6797]|nr:hypothetical protein [Acetobacteraceae bacterium H6797]